MSSGAPTLATLLRALLQSAAANIIPAPAAEPDDASLIESFEALKSASANFEVAPGLRLSDHFWTHGSHLRNGDVTARLLDSVRVTRPGTPIQGFIALYSTHVRSPLLYGPKRMPFRVRGEVEQAVDLDGPYIALVACKLTPEGRAEAFRAFAQPIYHARRFLPVGSNLERDVFRALEGLQVALDTQGIDCTIVREMTFDEASNRAEITIETSRRGVGLQRLRLAARPTPGAPERDADFVIVPSNWGDGSFVAWLDMAVRR